MTLLLELNDLGIRCYQDGKLLHQSPGIAVVNQQLLLGDDAWQHSRLHPLNTYTQFWSQLDTEPLSTAHRQVRHHGDLAYLHLQHIESQLPFQFAGQEVVFSLPGDMNRNALGLLLGIAQQCGLKTIGLIDHALASVLPQADRPIVHHIEMHLHHSVMTQLSLDKQTLQRQRVETFNEQGWLNLHNQLLRHFSDRFIQQTRFNPRHGADTEQALFNAIPQWLQQSAQSEHLSCQLGQHNIQVDTAEIRAFAQQALKPLLDKIAATPDLFVGDRLAQWIPILLPQTSAQALSSQQLSSAMNHLSHSLSEHPEGVRFISSLPCNNTTAQKTASDTPATHVLCHHKAYPLSGLFSLSPQGDLIRGEQAGALAYIANGRVRAGSAGITLNDQPLAGGVLRAGDVMKIEGLAQTLTFIGVEP